MRRPAYPYAEPESVTSDKTLYSSFRMDTKAERSSMSEDFFGDLGKSISRYTQNAVDKTSTFIEATKITAQISGEEREMDKLYRKIGEAVIRKADEGSYTLPADLNQMADDVKKHRAQIIAYKRTLADVKGMKVCPGCGELIDKAVAFCPKCGAPTPIDEDACDDESAESAVDAEFMTVPEEEESPVSGEASEDMAVFSEQEEPDGGEVSDEMAEEVHADDAHSADEVQQELTPEDSEGILSPEEPDLDTAAETK